LKKLERSLSLTSVIAISIGGMLGSGIFVLPGLAAAKTGSSVWLAYLLAAVYDIPRVLKVHPTGPYVLGVHPDTQAIWVNETMTDQINVVRHGQDGGFCQDQDKPSTSRMPLY